MRKIGIGLSATLLLVAGAGLFRNTALGGQARLASALCKFWICGNDNQLADLSRAEIAHGSAECLGLAKLGFSELLNRDVAFPDRWADLGDAYLAAGDLEKAGYCFSRTRELGPHSPQTLVRTGIFYFLSDQRQTALETMYRVLQLSGEFDTVAFKLYTEQVPELGEILKRGLPAEPRASQAFLRYLLDLDSGERAASLDYVRAVWDWIQEHSLADDKLAGDYVDYLLERGEFDRAAKSWAAHLKERHGDYLESNLLYNGSFESEPTDTTLDWKFMPVAGVIVTRDSATAHSGKWSLRIRFQGKRNIDFSQVWQKIVVRPGRYRVRAYIRTSGLTTDQGIGLRVVDAESKNPFYFSTDHVEGSSDWTKIQKSFVVPSGTYLISLHIVRSPSQKFDNKVEGTAWVDDVTLTAVP